MPTRTPLACTLAALAGMRFWFWASLTSGRREPWDDASCWSVACPAAVVLAGILGYLFPACPWRWRRAARGCAEAAEREALSRSMQRPMNSHSGFREA